MKNMSFARFELLQTIYLDVYLKKKTFACIHVCVCVSDLSILTQKMFPILKFNHFFDINGTRMSPVT